VYIVTSRVINMILLIKQFPFDIGQHLFIDS